MIVNGKHKTVTLLAAGLLALSGAAATGCGDNKGASEDIENAADSASNDAGNAADDAADQTGQAANDAQKELDGKDG